jgi:sialic acid synthase SpsE
MMVNKWINDELYFIAEAGCNHCGSLETALKMVDEAKLAGADCFKIQKRDMGSLSEYSDKKVYEGPHSFGKTYTEHRKALELSMEDIKKIADRTKSHGMDFSSSCWDKKSIDDMEPLVDFYKIQSADSHNFELIDYVAKKGKPIIMSVGGTSFEDLEKAIDIFNNNSVEHAILHCTPIYPLPFNQVNLYNVLCLKDSMICPVGYSGHELGIAVSSASICYGATIIERHFTLDRTMKGGDQSASLEPQGFSKMVRDCKAVREALGSYDKVSYDDEKKKLDSLNLTRKPFNWC